MSTVEFEGQQYDFPEDASQEEMTAALSSLPKEEEEVPAEDKQEPFAEEDTIKKDEGVRRDKAGSHISYKDAKVITGGRGHQLTKEEKKIYPLGTVIPDKVVKAWFKTDMTEADKDLTRILEAKQVHVPDDVYNILLNMTFNLGEKGISGFDDMWSAVEVGDWKTVSKEMLLNKAGTGPSKWFKQVGNRARRLSDRMAAIPSNVQEEEAAATDNLVPSKGGLFKDSETGVLFVIDEQGNKTEV